MPTFDLRTYVTLEDAFTRRLIKDWRKRSAPVLAAITAACLAKEWDKARQLATDLDLTEVGTENREWIKYLLRTIGVFGASIVTKGKPSFVASGSYGALLDRVTGSMLLSLEHGATAQVQRDVLQLIADDEAQSKAQKWDESQHPRDEQGKFTVRGFTGSAQLAAEIKQSNRTADIYRQIAFLADNPDLSEIIDTDRLRSSMTIDDIAKLDKTGRLTVPTAADAEARVEARARALLADAHVAVRVPHTVLKSIMEDARLKTQFETGTSSGDLDVTARSAVEQQLFDVPPTQATSRPVYGYAFHNIDNNKYDSGWTFSKNIGHYGDVSLILKDDVKERTTFTSGDSLFEYDKAFRERRTLVHTGEDPTERRFMPTPMVNPKEAHLGFDLFQNRRLLEWGGANATIDTVQGQNGVVETQIHGGVTLSDVSKVVLHYVPATFHEIDMDALQTLSGKVPVEIHIPQGSSTLMGREHEDYIHQYLPNITIVGPTLSALERSIPSWPRIGAALGSPKQAWDETQHPRDPQGRFIEAERLIAEAQAEGRTILFHSGDASIDADLASGIEPQMGEWVEEVLAGATDDEEGIAQIREQDPVAFYSHEPSWVSMKVARKLGKEVREVTVEDLKQHGQLSVVIADEGEFWESNEEGGATRLGGTETYAHDTGLGYESYDLPFGVESSDVFSHEAVAPAITLTGAPLLRFLARNYPTANLVADPQSWEAYQDQRRLPFPVQKKDSRSGRYVTPFVSFDQVGEDTLQLIASLNSSRLATWGFTAECEVRGVQRYRLTAVLDGRTSEFCRFIDGREFEVADARAKVIEALNVTDPNDLKTVQPWPKQTKAAMAEFAEMSDEELLAKGLHIPPYHPRCRTVCHLIEDQKVPTTTPPPIPAALDAQFVTTETLKEMGITATPAEVDQWNASVGKSPVDVLADLSGMEPANILHGALGPSAITFDGDRIALSARGIMGGLKYQVGTVLDPYTGTYYLTKAEFVADEVPAATQFMQRLIRSMVTLGQETSATSLVVSVAGNVIPYAKLGFVPSPMDWEAIRKPALASLEQGSLQPLYASLSPADRQLVKQLLLDTSEVSFGTLVDLPFTYQGKTLGQWLFDDVIGQFSLDLTDPVTVQQALGYLGKALKWEESQHPRDGEGKFTEALAQGAPVSPQLREVSPQLRAFVEREAKLNALLAPKGPLANPQFIVGLPDMLPQQQVKEYVGTKGQEWKAAPLPEGIDRGTPQECYANASRLILDSLVKGRDPLDYCEGYVYLKGATGMAILHGWAVTKDGTVIDNTLDHPEEHQYFGVRYGYKQYNRHIFKQKIFGVLGGDEKAALKVMQKGGL